MMRPVDAASPIMQLDPDFGALAVEVGTWTWSRPGLTPRLCSLLCLAGDLCCGTKGKPMEMHVQIALQNGATPVELREVVLTLAPWVGYPQTLEALLALKPMLASGSASEPGTPVPENALTALDGPLGEMLRKQLGTIWARPGLKLTERALLTLAADACLGSLGTVFGAHLRLARAVGASEEQIQSVLCFVGEYGFAKSVAALEAMTGR